MSESVFSSSTPDGPLVHFRLEEERALAKRKDAQPKIKFHAMSDLHFEGSLQKFMNEYAEWPEPTWPVMAPYLILAGDIGYISPHYEKYGNFLAKRCSEYKLVFIVLGNRDFPNRNGENHARVIHRIRQLESDKRMNGKLKLLECNRYDLEDNGTCISILGCTLWTQVRPEHDRCDEKSPSGLEGVPLNSREKHNRRYQRSLRWLQGEVKKIRTSEQGGKDRKIIVITHHSPFIRDSSKNTNDVGRSLLGGYSYYSNDILGGYGFDGLGVGDMWVYGHTHYTNDLVVDDVRVYSNQRGKRCPPLIKSPKVHEFDVERTFDF